MELCLAFLDAPLAGAHHSPVANTFFSLFSSRLSVNYDQLLDIFLLITFNILEDYAVKFLMH